MSGLTDRGVGSRLTTSIVAAIVGVGSGFTPGLLAAMVLTTWLEPRMSTDDEGWGIVIIWVGLAFGGAIVGGLTGLVVGYRRRPTAPLPPRPDGQRDATAS